MENNGEEKIIPQVDRVESPKKAPHIFTVSLIVLCALISLGVFAYVNLCLYKEAFEQASTVETPVVQADETKEWKTYISNGDYNFEMKYPPDWRRIIYTDSHGLMFNPPDPDCECDASPQLNITYYKSFLDFKMVNDYITDSSLATYMSDIFWLGKSEVKNIHGTNWTCGEIEGPGKQAQCVGQSTNGQLFFIRYNFADKIAEEVISTFKFTQPITEISSWKTYQNNEIGFSFRYPAEFGDFSVTVENGDTGKSYYGSFENGKYFTIGGITGDFTIGRGGYFLVFAKYLEEAGKYHHLMALGNKYLIEPTKILDIDNHKILLVNNNSYVDERGLDGPSINPGVNGGALINIQNNIGFKGIAVQNYSLKILSQSEFEKILSTFKFTK